MSKTFVWFHNSSHEPKDSAAFYENLLGWKTSEGPGGMSMFEGESGPFAAVGAKGSAAGWIPYVEVDDVDASTDEAVRLGATVLEHKTRGPAGEFSIVRDPGGSAVALWQKA